MKKEFVEEVAKIFRDKEIFPANGKAFLEAILKKFGENNMKFSCECEFQFELAWTMRQVFEKLGHDDYKIYFETLAKETKKTGGEKKDYIDLTIQYGDRAVLIELKYKKHTQKAQSWNSYLFLQDVERIEKFVGKNVSEGKLHNVKIEGGYAILLTDSCYYYEKHGKRRVWEKFSIHDDECMKGDLAPVDSKREYEPIHLKGEYLCEWNDYCEKEKYLIFEIK